MKWFKHDSDANADPRLLKVRIKYGLEGYGLYFYCLELIAGSIDENNITFELEHDSEVISHLTGIHYERVQEMMTFMVDLGLFEVTSGVITCMRLAKRLDQSMTSNPQMRKVISKIRENHDSVMIESCPDKIRLDKINKKGQKAAPLTTRFDEFWTEYPRKRKKKPAKDIWRRKKLDRLADTLINDVRSRLAGDDQWKKGFIPDPTTYLNQERWEDELKREDSRPTLDGEAFAYGLKRQDGESDEQLKRRLGVAMTNARYAR